jgi:hypothetical protein
MKGSLTNETRGATFALHAALASLG